VPSVNVAASTLLLTKDGWSPVKHISSSAAAIGVDRHGSTERRDVLLTHASQLRRTAFLGTPASFGEFSPATRILTYDGKTCKVGRLIENGSIVETRFETCTELPDECTWDSTRELIWDILCAAGALKDGDRVALKCRTIPDRESVKNRQFGTHHYCLFQRQELLENIALERELLETVLWIGAAWLRNDEESRLELERAFHIFGAFYTAALKRKQSGYRLAYDTLQHTAYICIADAPNAPPPVVKGACAFYGTSRDQEFTLSWDGGGWNPIASGFLLSPD
jgi:hypothetical protein